MPLKLKYNSLEVVYPEYDISTTHQSLWMSRNALHINRYLRCSIWKTLPIVHWRQKISGVIAMTILYASGKKKEFYALHLILKNSFHNRTCHIYILTNTLPLSYSMQCQCDIFAPVWCSCFQNMAVTHMCQLVTNT